MAIDNCLTLHRASNHRRLPERSTRIECDDARLGGLSSPRVQPERQLVIIDIDTLETALDNLSDRRLYAVCPTSSRFLH